MINLLSLNCSLGFAPYLRECIAEFLDSGNVVPRVVRQGGSGLIIRSDGELALRYQGRECRLDSEDSRHYGVTLEMRAGAYDTIRMTDEVVISNFKGSIFLSHPQSELWLDREAATTLVQMSRQSEASATNLPEWLNASVGGGRLLLSDQRNGRWVLLGADHIDELARRLAGAPMGETSPRTLHPPKINVKGLDIHLRSAFQLAKTLEAFGNDAELTAYEELTPGYSLAVARSTEGIELQDTNKRVSLTRREARKWADLMSAELDRLNVTQVERGRIRTVFADDGAGRWVLQWADEVFCPDKSSALRTGEPLAQRIGQFSVLLDLQTSSCVALTESEADVLRDSKST